MTSRERVLTALQLQEPDRVPFVDTIVPRMQQMLMGREDFTPVELARKLNMDAIWLDMFPPLFAKKRWLEGMEIVEEGLIKSDSDLKLMEFPDPSSEKLYEPVRRFVDAWGREDLALCVRIRLGASPTLLSMGLDKTPSLRGLTLFWSRPGKLCLNYMQAKSGGTTCSKYFFIWVQLTGRNKIGSFSFSASAK